MTVGSLDVGWACLRFQMRFKEATVNDCRRLLSPRNWTRDRAVTTFRFVLSNALVLPPVHPPTWRLTSSIGPNFGVIVPSVKVLKCVPSGLDGTSMAWPCCMLQQLPARRSTTRTLTRHNTSPRRCRQEKAD